MTFFRTKFKSLPFNIYKLKINQVIVLFVFSIYILSILIIIKHDVKKFEMKMITHEAVIKNQYELTDTCKMCFDEGIDLGYRTGFDEGIELGISIVENN